MIKGVIDQLDEWALLLEKTRGLVPPVDCHDILRGIDPSLSVQKKHQPRGTDASDLWVLKYGDPLASSDASFALAYKVEPEAEFEIKQAGHDETACSSLIMRRRGPKGYKVSAVAQHLSWAITAAAIKYYRRQANDI